MRDEVGDYDQDLVDSWFERGVERSSFSGRLVCEELADIAPRKREFWASLAFTLQRKELHGDAADAWAIAVAMCADEEARCATLFAAAHSWWDVHLEKGPHGTKTVAWELALASIEQASHLKIRTVQVHQWFAMLYQDVGPLDLQFDHLASALAESDGLELDWGDFWFAHQSLTEVDTYDALLRRMVDEHRFEQAGNVLQVAFDTGLCIQ
jgi:hypothetical protein